jgi:hypothetical protein
MVAVDSDAEIIEHILCERARFYAMPERFRTLTVFDRERGQFLLVDEGWNGYKRTHNTWVHVELRDGKFYIHEDGTQDGIATDLMKAGIPSSRIVLSFKHPTLRQDTPFAIA